MSGLDREQSFRTTLKQQKRRLSATKAPSKINLDFTSTLPAAQLKPVLKKQNSKENTIDEQPDYCPPKPQAPLKENGVGTSPKSSRESTPERTRRLGNLMIPGPSQSSPYLPRTPSPLIQDDKSKACNGHKETKPQKVKSPRSTPIPPGSPLLNRTPPSPTPLRFKEINKEIRRARSFRKSVEKSRENSRTRERLLDEEEGEKKIDEVCFEIKKHSGGRTGWKIMPENGRFGGNGLRAEALKKVVGMIQNMELSGHSVPERITIKV